jgi:hypothetical protein
MFSRGSRARATEPPRSPAGDFSPFAPKTAPGRAAAPQAVAASAAREDR